MHRIGAAGLLINQPAARPARCFGGAWLSPADGIVLAAWPLHAEGLLLVDLPPEDD